MDWKGRADVVVERLVEGGNHDEVVAEHLALVNERLDADGLRNKVWMVMPYRCEGPSPTAWRSTGCGRVLWYEAEVGVEGPRSWRTDGTYVATPFTAGMCPRCGGPMTHVIGSDVVFDGLRDPGVRFESKFTSSMTHADRMFRVPREPVTYVTEGCDADGNVIYGTAGHAFLSTPWHAIQRKLVEG